MPGVDYGDNLYGAIKFGNMQLVVIQATTDGAGVVTIDAANSSPGTTITGGAGGLMTIGFPTGQTVHAPSPPVVQKADSLGEIGTFRTLVASTGVGTLEFWPSNTAGVAAAVLSARIYVSFFVGSF